MKRDTRSAYRARAAATERMVDESAATVKAEQAAKLQSAKERAAAQRAVLEATPTVDPATITPGMWVLNRKGSAGEVLKVNRTTVAVSYMGFESRWPLDSIIAAKTPTKKEAA
jgi:hypothetical protein